MTPNRWRSWGVCMRRADDYRGRAPDRAAAWEALARCYIRGKEVTAMQRLRDYFKVVWFAQWAQAFLRARPTEPPAPVVVRRGER